MEFYSNNFCFAISPSHIHGYIFFCYSLIFLITKYFNPIKKYDKNQQATIQM